MPLPKADPPPPRANAQTIAYDRLKDWIVNGPLEAGETIRDTEVAKMLGVSRTPVREAIIRLAHESLVTVSVGRATRVAPLDFTRAPYNYRMGGLLDGYAAEQVADTIDVDSLKQMRGLLEEMAVETDVVQLQALDEEFHGVYHALAGNPILEEIMLSLTTEMRRIERAAFNQPHIRKEAHEEHIAILEALEVHDALAAKEAAIANWENSWQRISATLTPRGDSPEGTGD